MPDDNDKVIRVTIEYADGSARIAEGKDAEIWQKAVGQQSMIASIHGFKFPLIDWKEKHAT